jgi:hypothetical protein
LGSTLQTDLPVTVESAVVEGGDDASGIPFGDGGRFGHVDHERARLTLLDLELDGRQDGVGVSAHFDDVDDPGDPVGVDT